MSVKELRVHRCSVLYTFASAALAKDCYKMNSRHLPVVADCELSINQHTRKPLFYVMCTFDLWHHYKAYTNKVFKSIQTSIVSVNLQVCHRLSRVLWNPSNCMLKQV